MQATGLTIGEIADATGVSMSMVRYYERCGLVAPSRRSGEWRRYREGLVSRVRFIGRARALGFSLEEIGTLLKLEDGGDRRTLRRIAAAQLEETKLRIADLRRFERALTRVLHACETHAKSLPCSITQTLR
ncbi:MAG: hypothetical protein A3G24_01900 [Betaproteobacteria bacterium RIFCSPLOWO2_12_FULL_62_13]|nr:MAG: hypothetical protein A3G24_01900 [Betaproteobacteria bacterium RIFCSPLOWO2_12_FULL_62_13]